MRSYRKGKSSNYIYLQARDSAHSVKWPIACWWWFSFKSSWETLMSEFVKIPKRTEHLSFVSLTVSIFSKLQGQHGRGHEGDRLCLASSLDFQRCKTKTSPKHFEKKQTMLILPHIQGLIYLNLRLNIYSQRWLKMPWRWAQSPATLLASRGSIVPVTSQCGADSCLSKWQYISHSNFQKSNNCEWNLVVKIYKL